MDDATVTSTTADILEELGRAADALESRHYPHTTATLRAAAAEIGRLRADRDRLMEERRVLLAMADRRNGGA